MRKTELKDLQGCRIVTAEQDGDSIKLQLDNGREYFLLRIEANTDSYMSMREVIDTHTHARLRRRGQHGTRL